MAGVLRMVPCTQYRRLSGLGHTRCVFHEDTTINVTVRRRAWNAINSVHEAFYWHTDANPVSALMFAGARFGAMGEVELPEQLEPGSASK